MYTVLLFLAFKYTKSISELSIGVSKETAYEASYPLCYFQSFIARGGIG